MIWDNEVNDVYRKLDDTFKLKAKRLVKGTGLEFVSLLSAQDMVNNKSLYLLFVDDVYIRFQESSVLLYNLVDHCIDEMKERITERKNLEHHKQHDLHFDAVGLDPQIDVLCSQEYQLEKLIKHYKEIYAQQTKKV